MIFFSTEDYKYGSLYRYWYLWMLARVSGQFKWQSLRMRFSYCSDKDPERVKLYGKMLILNRSFIVTITDRSITGNRTISMFAIMIFPISFHFFKHQPHQIFECVSFWNNRETMWIEQDIFFNRKYRIISSKFCWYVQFWRFFGAEHLLFFLLRILSFSLFYCFQPRKQIVVNQC